MFLQIFGTPHNHPKSKSFFERVMNFAIADNFLVQLMFLSLGI